MKILIIDDDNTYRKLLCNILTGKGHEVVEAESGNAAWEMLQSTHYAFIITDWMMPGVSGPELVSRIRKADFPHYTYIIMLTARNAREDIVNGLEAGADDYLTKPFDLDELRARVAIGERILRLESRLRTTLKQLEVLATYDSLTNLLNRRALYEAIRNEWNRAYRENQAISLIMLDVDHFKEINDRHGHLVGDQALCHVAQLLTQHKRSYDIIGRWGGEEFLLLLPNTDLHEATCVAERLRHALATTPFELTARKKLFVFASFGVAGINSRKNENFEKYIQRADQALYQAKNAGRDRVCAFDQITPQGCED
ncbi:MAG: GGDEF domain-containing response regulator [Chloroflexota bacterium]